MIYADNAATTRISDAALEKWCEVSQRYGGNPSSLHQAGVLAKRELNRAREIVAVAIGAEPDEIYFTSGGTESDNWAIKGAAFLTTCPARIAVSTIEHHAVLRAASALEKIGVTCDLISVDSQGNVRPCDIESLIRPDTLLFSVMLANNEIGTIQPIAELAETTHRRGVLFHTDAVQAVGHIPINVRQLGVDLLSASAHKFNGPRGVGFLYVRRGVSLAPLLSGGAQESNLRAGTENVAGIAAMAAALADHVRNLDEEEKHLRQISSRFRDEIRREIDDAHFNGNPDSSLPGLVSLSIRCVSGESLLHLLDMKGIAVSTGAACDSQNTQVSHVLRAIGLDDGLAKGTLRISFGHENTEEEAVTLAREIAKAVKKLKTALKR
ncbi:MAG: cysteine desulfurase [Thermoguttaceae bacterium]|nr:cysteine desulfurase [Thermoguttaceae bacterium]